MPWIYENTTKKIQEYLQSQPDEQAQILNKEISDNILETERRTSSKDNYFGSSWVFFWLLLFSCLFVFILSFF